MSYNKQYYSNFLEFLLYMQQIAQQPCPNCRRSVESSRLPLHIHMCSTMKLRRSKIFTKQQPVEDKQTYLDCIFCNQKFLIGQMEQHLSNCKNRQIQCKICGKMYPFSLLAEHEQFCLKNQFKKAKQQTHHEPQKTQNIQKDAQQIQIKNKNQEKNSEINFENIKQGISSIGSILYSEGTKLSQRINNFLQENKDPAIQGLKKLKQNLWYKIQDVFAFIAADPNTDGLPPTKIRQIQQGQYHARNDGNQQEVCTICYCDLQDEEPIKILHCRHIYHPECIDKWMKINKLCPLCKNDQSKLPK